MAGFPWANLSRLAVFKCPVSDLYATVFAILDWLDRKAHSAGLRAMLVHQLVYVRDA